MSAGRVSSVPPSRGTSPPRPIVNDVKKMLKTARDAKRRRGAERSRIALNATIVAHPCSRSDRLCDCRRCLFVAAPAPSWNKPDR